MDQFLPTGRTQVKRLPKRGVYDKAQVHAILDEGFVCHVGFAQDGQTYVIPTGYVRVDDCIYIHGSPASRMLTALNQAIDVCLTVTLLDGLVLARSAFHHSMNYRSVVVLGKARLVTDTAEKVEALHAFVDHVVPGRWDEVRQPTAKELQGTYVLALPLDEASAKVRTGPPIDDEEDYALPIWAGVVPLCTQAGEPIADPRLPSGLPLFDALRVTTSARTSSSGTRA
jgi:nitroimidazol reductase NimA-like FMN-containing flavoprotein (pyridoxamine 5'-phosphate oxidase superfamily)